ncbi:hypothetical protein D3C73_1369440 [compost metagenome]
MPQQFVGAFGARVQRRSGHGEDIAALLARQSGGDQGAGTDFGLDHHHAARQARDDAVAAREVARLRSRADGAFRDDAAALDDLAIQVGVVGRIDVVHPAAQHRDRAGFQRAQMRRRIHPSRQTRDDDVAAFAQLLG